MATVDLFAYSASPCDPVGGSRVRPIVHAAVCAAFVIATGLAYVIATEPPDRRGFAYVGLHVVLSVLMFASMALVRPGSALDAQTVIASGILARVLLVAAPVFSTDDVGRYLWDGRVALMGIDPYRVVPSDVVLSTLAETWMLPATHLGIPTIYPPGALAAFAMAATAGPIASVYVWKAIVTLASVASLVLAARLLDRRGLTNRLPLVALSPLLVLEGGIGAHVDALSALGLIAAVYLRDRHRPGLAGVALGVGVLCKLAPALALLPLLAATGLKARGRLLAAAAGTVAAGYAAAFSLGLRPLGSMATFLSEWRSGSPIYVLVEQACGVWVAVGVSIAIVVSGQVLGIALARRPGRTLDGVAAAMLAALLAAPVVYPWYLVPLVPLLAATASAAGIAWTLVLPLTYPSIHSFGAGVAWIPNRALNWIVRPAILAGLAVDGARVWRHLAAAPVHIVGDASSTDRRRARRPRAVD